MSPDSPLTTCYPNVPHHSVRITQPSQSQSYFVYRKSHTGISVSRIHIRIQYTIIYRINKKHIHYLCEREVYLKYYITNLAFMIVSYSVLY